MKRKKIAVFTILAALLIVSFVSCGKTKQEEDGLLPYGLQFGATYDEVKKAFEENGGELSELKRSSTTNAYVAESQELDLSFTHSSELTRISESHKAYLDYQALSEEEKENLEKSEKATIMVNNLEYTMLGPSASFFFNDKKELYEMVLHFYEYASSNNAYKIEIRDYYNNYLKVEPNIFFNGYDKWQRYQWNTERAYYSLDISQLLYNDIQSVLTMHCYEYDLDRE